MRSRRSLAYIDPMSGEDLPPVASEEEDEEEVLASLEASDETEGEGAAENAIGAGAAVIRRQLKNAPNSPGVYRMIDGEWRRALCGQGAQHPQPASRPTRAARRIRTASPA